MILARPAPALAAPDDGPLSGTAGMSAATAVPQTTTYLHPGQIFVTAEPTAVMTILGYCVAVCLWDRHLRVGGMNHYLLPHWVNEAEASPRFGNVAIQRLIERLVALGSQTARLQAKVFGGACVLEAFRARHLGNKNVEVARRALDEASIPVVHEDVGGQRGRKLLFRVDDGATSVKLL
jgi:chemotaxis protein CheD